MNRSHPEKHPRRNAQHQQPGNDKRAGCDQRLIILTLQSEFHSGLPASLDAEFLARRIVPKALIASRQSVSEYEITHDNEHSAGAMP